MRWIAACLAALLLATPAVAAPARSTRAAQAPTAAPASAQGQPPHAFLFGTWTGGLFPVPRGISAEACLSQPVAIFTRDLVMRATITQQVLVEREIVTARVTPSGVDFVFVGGTGNGLVQGLPGLQQAQPMGFGCDSPNDLHVQRRGANEIEFTGCSDFPYPLVRCP